MIKTSLSVLSILFLLWPSMGLAKEWSEKVLPSVSRPDSDLKAVILGPEIQSNLTGSLKVREFFHSPGNGLMNVSQVNLRSGPSLNNTVLYIIAGKGTRVEVLGQRGDWLKVKADDHEGWIFRKLITLENGKETFSEKIKQDHIKNEGRLASLEYPITRPESGHFLNQKRLAPGTPPARPENNEFAAKVSGAEDKLKKVSAGTGPGEAASNPALLKLDINGFIRLVQEKNERIRSQWLEWLISQEAVKREQAIFEMEFVTSYKYEKNRKRNTAQEILSRQFQEVFDEANNHFDLSIEGLIKSGGRLRFGYSMKDVSNNLNAQVFGFTHEFPTFVGLSYTQPLLKNRGRKATMANIWTTEADAEMAFQGYRQQTMLIIANASAAYWDLLSAQEKYKARLQSIRIAERILKDNIERVREGHMAESEVLEARAGLAIRKSAASAAKQELVKAMNNVRMFFSFSADGTDTRIAATDPLEIEDVRPEFNESIRKTLRLRPEYLISRIKIDKEDIRLAFAKNQRYPQLDLSLSYGLNGLSTNSGASFTEAFVDRKFESWTVGLELRVPLGGGKKSRSELAAARQRKRQALLELKSIEVAVTNAVDTSIRYVLSASVQAGYYTKVEDLNRQLLEVELARLNEGRSDSRLVLAREDNFNKAIDAKLESLIQYKRALLELEIAEGTLLITYGIEVMEAN